MASIQDFTFLHKASVMQRALLISLQKEKFWDSNFLIDSLQATFD